MTSAIETALTELSANLRHQAPGYKFDRLNGLIDAAREELAGIKTARSLEQEAAKDAKRYRFIVSNNLILSGGTQKFDWPIAPFGRECDRYLDAAIAAKGATA